MTATNSAKPHGLRKASGVLFWSVANVAMATGVLLIPAGLLFAFLSWVHVVGALISAVCVPILVCIAVFYVVIVGPALDAAYDWGNGSAGDFRLGHPIASIIGLVGGGWMAQLALALLRTIARTGPYAELLHSPLFTFDAWVVCMSTAVVALNVVILVPDMVRFFIKQRKERPPFSVG